MLVRLDSDGHDPDFIVDVTPDEAERLAALATKYGYACAARTAEDQAFIKEIAARPEVKDAIPTIRWYV